MNPGNGIETNNLLKMKTMNTCFLFMNPGNGIETRQKHPTYRISQKFLIYESRQRD